MKDTKKDMMLDAAAGALHDFLLNNCYYDMLDYYNDNNLIDYDSTGKMKVNAARATNQLKKEIINNYDQIEKLLIDFLLNTNYGDAGHKEAKNLLLFMSDHIGKKENVIM